MFKRKRDELKKETKPRSFEEILYPGWKDWCFAKNQENRTSSLRADPGFVNNDSLQLLQKRLLLSENYLNVLFLSKNSNRKNYELGIRDPQALKVLFLVENFRPWKELSGVPGETNLNSLDLAFEEKTAKLFLRMMKAMNFSQEEFMVYPLESQGLKDQLTPLENDIREISHFFRPEIIVTLGAQATHKFLKITDRLSLIHGKFFLKELGEGYSVQVTPLFHPSIIEANLNMKKTAWLDMQKIMKFLKKIP